MRARNVACVILFTIAASMAFAETIPSWTAPPYWLPGEASQTGATGSHRLLGESAKPEMLALPTAPLPFVAVTPCRLLDTRNPAGTYGGPALAPGVPRSFPVAGACGIPADAGAVSLNAAVTNTAGPGFVALYPEGTVFPGVSTVNYTGAGETVANAAVVAVSSNGFTALAGVSGTDLIVDVNGYYAPQNLVNTINTKTGDVTLAQGANVTITPAGSTLTIAASAPAGATGPTGPTGAIGPTGPTGPTGSAPHYAQVVIVAKSGGDFTTVQGALNSITDAGASKRYLVWVAPGVYSEQVTMKQYVDIEGAGELATKITYTGGATENAGSTVRGADDAELRSVSVENTGGAAYAVAVFNTSKAVRLTHVSATASGGTSNNAGVCNFVGSSAVLAFVKATGIGGQYAYGVENSASSPAMTHVDATGKDGTVINHGVMNMVGSAPIMTLVNATASGGGLSYGVKNESGSDPYLSEVVAKASGATTSNYGIYNHTASPTIRNSVATAESGSGSLAGIYNYASGTDQGPQIVAIDNCRVGGLNYGVRSEMGTYGGTTSLTVKIVHSWISGPTNSIWAGTLTYVGTSQLLGGAVHDGGLMAPLVRCYACYDENFTNPGADAAAKLVTCP